MTIAVLGGQHWVRILQANLRGRNLPYLVSFDRETQTTDAALSLTHSDPGSQLLASIQFAHSYVLDVYEYLNGELDAARTILETRSPDIAINLLFRLAFVAEHPLFYRGRTNIVQVLGVLPNKNYRYKALGVKAALSYHSCAQSEIGHPVPMDKITRKLLEEIDI
jgi:hypothetical protein